MTVKEIIILACEMIDKDQVVEKLEKDEVLDEESENLKNDLVKCFNFIQNEIATEFVPLLTSEKIKSQDGFVELSSLKERLAYVVSFKDKFGKNVRHKIIGDKICFEGEGKIEYCYCPAKKSIDDECKILLPERVIACGLLREYFLLQGLVSEATIFETKFKNSLANFVTKKTNITLSSRSWQ